MDAAISRCACVDFGFFDMAMPENFGVPFWQWTAKDPESKVSSYRSGPEMRKR